MLIYSMTVSLDGFAADRDGGIGWTVPSDEQFLYQTAQVGELGCYLLGRRLYETMLPWETDPAMRATERLNAFADIWCALPKIVFSATLDSVRGNARLATAPLADELAAARGATDKDLSIGGPTLAAAAIRAGLVDELRVFRSPVVLGGGTALLPPLAAAIAMELIETRTFGSQVIYERHRRTS